MKTKNFKSEFLSRLALLIVLASLSIPVSGQIENHLILKKNGYRNKVHFLTGDPIIDKIDYLVKYRKSFNFRATGKALMIAAPGYLVIGAINEIFHQRGSGLKASELVPSRTNLIVAGSLLAVGLILPSLQVRKYPLGKKFTLRIVQSDPALNR
ncbi:MAG: hypothetical protein NTV01_05680 [Bacteroidia bacterium]|nr:hypothetical protein [Bacteroidia bacterium]